MNLEFVGFIPQRFDVKHSNPLAYCTYCYEKEYVAKASAVKNISFNNKNIIVKGMILLLTSGAFGTLIS